MKKEKIEVFYPTSLAAWRRWLEKNHLTSRAVWLVFYKKSSDKKSLTWSESVDVALCFGWIDSKKIKIDEVTSHQYFSKRKAKSTWSKINKLKVQQLIQNGQMTQAGFESIEKAKQNGSWTILDEVEDLKIPKDLEEAFREHKGSKEYFLAISNSMKKGMLQWIVLAKRPETRKKRIREIAELAGQKQRPLQFR